MVRLTELEYWHSCRPPNRNALFVAVSEVASIREPRFDDNRSEKVSEITMKDGRRLLVEGRPDEIAAALGAEECPTSL